MQAKRLVIIVSSLTLMLLAAGVAGAIPNRAFSSSAPAAALVNPDLVNPDLDNPALSNAAVSSGITYQGRLTDADGARLTGTYTMRFVVYNAATAGTALWDSGEMDVAVEAGLFTVALNVDQGDFNGQAVWLSILVGEQTLSPRQEILPAPYALSLRPGADIHSDAIVAGDAVLAGYAEATGMALFGEAMGGIGLHGYSQGNYGVLGRSTNSWGGYFTSGNGYGVRVESLGDDHYDHGAYITSDGGYGVYAQSAQNQGVRAEAGDVTGIAQPLGPVGVVGIGQGRGAYGASQNGAGVYGTSSGNYGVWGQSETYRGVTGRTNRTDNNYGLYTPDNLFAANTTVMGSSMQVMQNNGSTALEPGDVVVFGGVTQVAMLDNAPLAQVSAASAANSVGVAGVVVSRFNIDAVDPDLEGAGDAELAALAEIEITPAGSAEPGEYVLVVVQGLAQVKVNQVASNTIVPGDLLATSDTAGTADHATTFAINGVETTVPGTVFAKALETVDGSQEMIYVYVTLQ